MLIIINRNEEKCAWRQITFVQSAVMNSAENILDGLLSCLFLSCISWKRFSACSTDVPAISKMKAMS